jgi:lauroyl/myristoyl acyltransferase
LVILIMGFLFTIFMPRRWDRRWIEFAQKRFLSARAHRVRNLARLIHATLTELSTAQSLRAAEDHYRLLVELWWGRFRSVGPRGWRPEIEIEGLEHLEAARSKGHGAVLWRTRFTENSIFLQGLSRYGLPLVHLSTEGHGSPDRSRLGVRWSARLYRRAEDPYVEERVQIPMDGSLGYVRRLLEKLGENCAVSIIGENKGRQNIEGVVLGRSFAYASGSPALAWRSGAELLTAYSIRLAPFRYRVVIQSPLGVDRGLDRKKFVSDSVAEFCKRLEEQIRNHPADWLGWQGEDRPVGDL